MIICILGAYGSGKDTFADELEQVLPNSKKIKSYTTRPPRYPDESTHIFIPYTSCICHAALKEMTVPDKEKLSVPENWLAYSIIDGNFYWTEKEQFDNKYNIYVIDDVGLKQVMDSQFDDVYIIHINRPQELIDVSEKRIQRQQQMTGFDYSKYIDFYVENDEDIAKLTIQAHLVANDIVF